MRAQIEILNEVFKEWLRIHDLDYDYWIYTRDEWLGRGEEIFKCAELIIAFDNQLIDILNYTGPWEIEEELQDLAGGFGYYFEMGNHWNIGFYPLEDWPPLPARDVAYLELLRDTRWADKRKRIITRSSGKCEDCGSGSEPLDVHHCYYRYGRYPWQYPDAALLALCRKCHEFRTEIELEWRGFMPRLKTSELQNLKETLDKCLYWFDRDRLFVFLSTLSRHDVQQSKRLGWLLETRSHPAEREESA